MRHSTTFALAVSVLLFSTLLCAADDQTDQALAHAKTVYSQQGPKAALPEYQAVLERYHSSQDRRGEAVTLGLIGNCYKRLGDYPKALDYLGQALKIKREIHDRAEEGRTLSHLGLVYWETADYPKAIDHLTQSIAIARELHDAQLEAAALNNLSLVFDEQGDYTRSLEQYKRALELHRSVGYEPGQSDTLGNIGGVYLLLGRYSEAADYYTQALAISQRLELKPSETQDLGNLALTQYELGKIHESVATLDKAIVIAHEAGMAKEEADWLRAKASSLVALGQFKDALADYERARSTYIGAGLKREAIELFADLGKTDLALGDVPSSEKNFEAALKLSTEIGHKRGAIDNSLSLAELRSRAADYTNAVRRANDALESAKALDDRPAQVRALLLIGEIRRGQKRWEAALASTKEAQQLAESRDLMLANGDALDQESDLELDRKQFPDALTNSDRALAIAAASGEVDLQWRAKYHRGQALVGLGREEEAANCYREAVTIIEGVRNGIAEPRFRTGYLREKQQVYVALVRLLLKLGKPGEAFTFSERLREYSYRLSQDPGVPENTDPKLVELRSRIRRLEDLTEEEKARPLDQQRAPALRTFSDELITAQREYEALLESHSGIVAASAILLPDLATLRRRLPDRSAVIEFVVDRESVVAFVLTRDGLKATAVKIREADLSARVSLLRGLVRDTKSEGWRKPATSLGDVLVAPLISRGWLNNVDTLLLVPHGILNYVPFSALIVGHEVDTKVLVESYQIAELPSAASLLAKGTSRPSKQDSVVAFAPSRANLQFAIPEAQEVAHTVGGRSQLFVGKSATETRFKQVASSYDLVHLATHGYFNRLNPAFSGLQFEADSQNDGRLEVHEIAQLHLHARLVTLSACDTGVVGGAFDEIPAGDEFVGLNRAFLEAGSQAVLASLWEVNDRSTLEVMKRLYTALATHSGVAALAVSQRAMLKDPQYRHPYYWASFVYVGKDFSFAPTVAEKR